MDSKQTEQLKLFFILEKYTLLDFLQYADATKYLAPKGEAHRQYMILLENIKRASGGHYDRESFSSLIKFSGELLYFSLVHSFIIDPEDEYIRSNFTEEELSEVVHENYRAPSDLDLNLLEFVSSFAKANKIVYPNRDSRGVKSSASKARARLQSKNRFPYHHVKAAVADWVTLLESDPNPLVLDLPEAWDRTNV
ncbi:hypothetical protein BC938DRAFT_473232 [Jimgerdemannia flammicorona]|uniref:Uncharacterized protein n=1 Tax=Jimgerdemannia flammicorona TaxID=994334 RepID=A0A433QTF5_9FUNG|nr:hypothetical protein BC938DRAFT_473232 [Jimgerdemannia flammicorona]